MVAEGERNGLVIEQLKATMEDRKLDNELEKEREELRSKMMKMQEYMSVSSKDKEKLLIKVNDLEKEKMELLKKLGTKLEKELSREKPSVIAKNKMLEKEVEKLNGSNDLLRQNINGLEN